jgi:3-oxoacyl-[acyl-carrier protein] reductase
MVRRGSGRPEPGPGCPPAPVSELRGKVAVVTGGSRGIGVAIAGLLAERGAAVVVSGRDENRLKAAVQAMEVEGRSVVGVVADAARREDTERLVEAARSEFGGLDVLVNNAGITRDALLVRMKDEDWDRVMEINLRGAFLMTRAAGRVMMRQRSGRIVNITSAAGMMGNAGQANYSAAKAGLIGLTKATARELAHWQILVNAVAPGLIETDMTAAIPATAREALLAQVPLGRVGTVREVAEMVGFLAGEGSAYVTGQVFHVNGGMYM